MRVFIILLLFPFFSLAQTTKEDVTLLIESKRYEDAEQLLQHYVAENPSNLESLELLGDVYAYQGKWNEAIKQYKKLTDLKPSNANYHYKYGGVLSMKATQTNVFVAVTYIADIKKAFLTASQLDESHIDARWALVKLYTELPAIFGGSKKIAIAYTNELESLSKVDGFLAKGYLYDKDDDLDKAEFYYKKALEIGGSKTCYKELSVFYLKHDEKEKALNVLKQGYATLKEAEFEEKIKEITGQSIKNP